MKKTVIISSILLFFLQTLQAQQPHFTEFCTANEKNSCVWYNKITTVDTLKNHYIQLVTSSPDCFIKWVCVQVVDRTTGKLVQSIDLNGYDSDGYEWITCGDYNFDGYDDFFLTAGVDKWGVSGYGYYFLYDEKTETFIVSEELNDLGKCEFNDDKTIIKRHLWNDDEGKIQAKIDVYQYIDNKLALIFSEEYFDDENANDTLQKVTMLQSQKTIVIPASVSITKEWTDKNGKNILTVQGRDLCCPDCEYGPHDGFPSKVEVILVNNKHKLFLTDSLTFDQYQMQTMHIREKEIWTTTFNSTQIVFIPVFLCGNYDLDTHILYFILYDNQKWLIRVQYLYENEGDGVFRLNDDLKRKLNFIQSEKLRNKIIEQITQKYKTVEEFESVFETKKTTE